MVIMTCRQIEVLRLAETSKETNGMIQSVRCCSSSGGGGVVCCSQGPAVKSFVDRSEVADYDDIELPVLCRLSVRCDLNSH
jgi:hypothetical protein